MTAGIEKIFSSMPNVGFLSHAAKLANEAAAIGVTSARAAEISRLIWNDRIDAAMTAFFIAVVLIILADSTRIWTRLILGSGRGTRAQQAAA
jgi:carbon starvation protein